MKRVTERQKGMPRLNAVVNHEVYQTYYKRICECETDRVFCCHQMNHLLDVARIAYIKNLEEGLGFDKELIYVAAVLHDIGKSFQYRQQIPHEIAGERIARRILDSLPTGFTFTDEEKANFGDKYIYLTEAELKNIGFQEKNSQVIIPSNVNSIKELPYNQKEYLLKREVFEVNAKGERTGKSSIFYIHITFDMFENNETSTYDVKKKFDTLYTEDEFNHFLLVFYRSGFAYRNKYMIDNNRKSYIFNFGSVDMDFSEMENMDYITHKLTEVLIPEMKMQYTFNTFIYAVLGPIFVALLAFIFIRNKNTLITYKHYYNIAALTSIPISIVFFTLEWIPFFIRIGIMELYIVFFAIYYFFVVNIINKNVEIE